MKLKKVLAVFMLVLAAVLLSFEDISVFTDLSKTVSAAEIYGDFEYEVLDDGTAKIVKYTGNDETVNIPSEINGKKVTVIGGKSNDHFEVIDYFGVFEGNTNVKTVNIQNGVEIIGGGAFSGCKSLISVNIPDSVTKIDSYAFYDCPNLKTVNIGSGVEEIKSNAFIRCFDLEEINVDENNQTFLSDDGVLFSKNKDILIKCPSAKEGSYIIPDSVAEIAENAFIACNGLTEIKIPESVTKIEDFAFTGCSGVTSINIPDKLTKIASSSFFGCEGLTSVRIPEGVTVIEAAAFDGCTGLISVIIPDSVTEIGRRLSAAVQALKI